MGRLKAARSVISTDLVSGLLFPGVGCIRGLLARLGQPSIRNIHVPKSSLRQSCECDLHRFELYELHSYPLCTQLLALLHISVVSKCICEHDRGINAPPKQHFRADAPIRGKSLLGAYVNSRRVLFADIWGSIQCGTCTPMPNGINFLRWSMEASFSVNYERFTVGGFHFIPELSNF